MRKLGIAGNKRRRLAVTYRRVSTEEQAEHGNSLQDQLEVLRAYCKVQGFQVLRHFCDEGYSGTTMKRPALKEALKLACEQKLVLVTYKLDRLTRNLRNALAILDRLRESGADIAMVSEGIDTNTAFGKTAYALIATFAEFTSLQIGERVSLANDATVRKKGHRTNGNQPLGFRLNANCDRVVYEPEMRVVRWLFRTCEHWTPTEQADWLNAARIKTPRQWRGADSSKASWSRSAIRSILKNPAYQKVIP